MNRSGGLWLSGVVAVVAASCLGISVATSFRAGCAGDPKSGSYGDPVRALALEGWGAQFELLGVIAALLALAIFLRYGRGASIARSIVTAFPMILVVLPLHLLLIQVETWGVQACF